MNEKLQQIRENAVAQIEAADSLEKLNEIRITFLGKKGELTAIMKSMKDIPKEDRPAFGQMVNETRTDIESKMDAMKNTLARKAREAQMAKEVIDVTLPAKKSVLGHRHPNTIALDEVERIFVGMGYEVIEGPEIEKDYYNFEALNIPAITLQKMSRIHFILIKRCF